MAEEFPTPERQLIGIAEDETVAVVEIGVAVFKVGEGLLAKISVVHCAQTGAGRVIERVRVDVSGFEHQSVAKTLFQARQQRVVIGLCIGAEGGDRVLSAGLQ